MRPPTGNAITQGKHGAFNAVDYASGPDPMIYAPEDMSFYAYLPNAGDAGNNLQMTGANGRHGFCHLEYSLLEPGQSVKKGQPIGKMGYTGLTIPKGPGGRHLHWVIYKNGVYVYPPSLITEPFEEEDMPAQDRQVRLLLFMTGMDGQGIGGKRLNALDYNNKEVNQIVQTYIDRKLTTNELLDELWESKKAKAYRDEEIIQVYELATKYNQVEKLVKGR